jgi:hypothetical protein
MTAVLPVVKNRFVYSRRADSQKNAQDVEDRTAVLPVLQNASEQGRQLTDYRGQDSCPRSSPRAGIIPHRADFERIL